jgi:membrane-associated phospholipid phosphatase
MEDMYYTVFGAARPYKGYLFPSTHVFFSLSRGPLPVCQPRAKMTFLSLCAVLVFALPYVRQGDALRLFQ